jgi:hypothetical protein
MKLAKRTISAVLRRVLCGLPVDGLLCAALCRSQGSIVPIDRELRISKPQVLRYVQSRKSQAGQHHMLKMED